MRVTLLVRPRAATGLAFLGGMSYAVYLWHLDLLQAFGPIGLMLCACVADAGGWPVTIGGRSERHRLAPAFGARPGDPHNADVVIEAAGTEDAWRDGWPSETLTRSNATAQSPCSRSIGPMC